MEITADDPANEGGLENLRRLLQRHRHLHRLLSARSLCIVSLSTLKYTYYADGLLKTITDSESTPTVTTYTYNGDGWMSNVKQSIGGTICEYVNYTYYADGKVNVITRYSDNGTTQIGTSTTATTAWGD